jgi:hypothetical protein
MHSNLKTNTVKKNHLTGSYDAVPAAARACQSTGVQ